MSLSAELAERIGRNGPITFASFMEAALYDPEEGFYVRPPIGEAGHFVTSPHVSPAFADLLARQVAECWDHLGRPETFTVVEVGAGDGTLARGILTAVRGLDGLGSALRYVAVERTPGQRAALEEQVETAEALEGVEPFTGCVLANEVLDNLPFHRLRGRDGRVVEVLVGVDGDRLVEMEGEPAPEAAAVVTHPPADGQERPASPAAVRLVEAVGSKLARGYSFFFDYGFAEGVSPGPVHAYRDHRVLEDVLADPGSRDITAAVDFDAVLAAGRGVGLQAWGPVPQREALLALGYRLWASGVRARQAEAEAEGDWRRANRLFQARSRASILIDEQKLGGLWLAALATEGLPPPAAVLGDRETGC
ncbi:MAG TPA: SAM-dependent methyltransferase [Actinomycetota bacterium]|nr:SAM-dependent methyltransferase [Actinomycetota bacterium]